MKIAIVLLAILTTILLSPIKAIFLFDEDLKIWAQFLFVRIPVFPLKKKEKVEKSETKKKTKSGTKDKKKLNPQELRDKLDAIFELIPKVIDGLGGLLRAVCLSKLKLNIRVGGENAYETGMNYGKINAGVYTSLALVGDVMKLRRPDKIDITADFVSEETEVKAYFHISTIPIVAIIILLKLFKDILPELGALAPKKPKPKQSKPNKSKEDK